MHSPPENRQQAGDFAPTRWSVVVRAREGSDSQRRAAMEALARSYWYPLYAFLRRSGKGAEDAEDLVQEFFARLLAGRLLDAATPERGRFRTLLLVSLRNFATDSHRLASAEKRGGGAQAIPLDAALAEEQWQADAGGASSPELAFDRAWADALLAAVEARLRREFARVEKGALFEALWPLVNGAPRGESNEAIGIRFGMSANAAAAALLRLRDRYAEAVREEIAQSVSSDEEIEEELRHLLALFS